MLYTAPLAVKLGGSILTALTGVSISVNRTAGTKVISTLLGGEAAARYLAVIAVFISFQSAHEQYALGNDSAGHFQVGMAINFIHRELAYAATKGIGRGVFTAMAEGAIQRGAVARVMQFGLASLAVPVFGEVALLISSVVALGMVAYSAAEGIHSASKSSVYHMFYHHLDAISASQIPILNDKHCHELYTSTQLPKEARSLFEEIKNISDDHILDSKILYDYKIREDPNYVEDYIMGSLSWRAVIPSHLQDYSLDSIRAMVELPAERLTETSMRDRQSSRLSRARIVQSVDDIITYYKYMTNPDSDPDLLGDGRRYLNKDDRLKISNALELGNFIPEVRSFST